MKVLTNFFVIVLVLILLILLFFFENIKGYYKFIEYCKNDAGLHINSQLERGFGIYTKDAKNKMEALAMSNATYFSFIRYLNEKDGKEYDFFSGDKKGNELGYENKLANLDNSVKYRLKIIEKNFKNLGLQQKSYEISDIRTNTVLVILRTFNFEAFDSNNAILGLNERYSCVAKNNIEAPHALSWIRELEKAFNN